jgi:RimJ/RimL family protein N-acetyltransferase
MSAPDWLSLEEVAIPHPWRQSICTADDRTIGYVSVKPESGNDRHRAHISYAVGFQYWGQGIATIAIKMAIGAVFKQFPDLVRIEALVELDNGGSQRVLEKVGFKREGLLRKYGFNKGQIRDMFMFSVLSIDEIMV